MKKTTFTYRVATVSPMFEHFEWSHQACSLTGKSSDLAHDVLKMIPEGDYQIEVWANRLIWRYFSRDQMNWDMVIPETIIVRRG